MTGRIVVLETFFAVSASWVKLMRIGFSRYFPDGSSEDAGGTLKAPSARAGVGSPLE